MRLRGLLWLGLVLASTSQALATPSTLIWIPSTDVQPAGVVHLGHDTYTTPGSGSGDFTDFGITVGIAKNAEVGLDYWTGTDEPWLFNAKIRLAEETDCTPAVAAGVYNLASNDTNGQNVAYMLLSKTFSGTRLTGGYGWGRRKVLGDDRNMIMLGVDRALGDRWWVGADYQGGKSALGAFSVGASYKLAPNTSVLLGYDWYNSSDIKDTLNVQIDIDVVKF